MCVKDYTHCDAFCKMIPIAREMIVEVIGRGWDRYSLLTPTLKGHHNILPFIKEAHQHFRLFNEYVNNKLLGGKDETTNVQQDNVSCTEKE